MGLGILGLGSMKSTRYHGLVCGGARFRVQGLGLLKSTAYDGCALGLRVSGLWFRVYGLGFMV